MTLYLFTQYAAITAIFLVAVVTISLSIKSYFDERTFTANLWLSNEITKMNLEKMHGTPEDSFDKHVETTPGMRLHTLN
jgi:hypothetical protein